MKKKIILQMGTNNWQRQGEFAPGSGILHESHHLTYNQMPDVVCYSIYPSKIQTSDDPKVRIFKLDHDIPICESVSPVSTYRFHSMSEKDFQDYIDRLFDFVDDYVTWIEEHESKEVDMIIAHHTFLNPLVATMINDKRIQSVKSKISISCFVHGTALKMFAHEKRGIDPEYPARFLPFMNQKNVFSNAQNITNCIAISHEQIKKFSEVYTDFPKDKVFLAQNGYNSSVFKPSEMSNQEKRDYISSLELPENTSSNAPKSIPVDYKKMIVFCGKFADWKRIDSLLHAAKIYEQESLITLIIGTGPEESIRHYHRLAYDELGLKNLFFLGPKDQISLANINQCADIGVYPSKNEPFGLVLIECMACGTPVIGANSGGPMDFVTSDVGGLVDEGSEFHDRLAAMIQAAIESDWKNKKGDTAADYARDNFSMEKQCQIILECL